MCRYASEDQGSSSNGVFLYINLYKFKDPLFTKLSVQMKAKSGNALFMNMDKENIAFNTSSEDIMISPGYY